MMLPFTKWWEWHRWMKKAVDNKVMYEGALCWVLKSGLVAVELRKGLK